MRAPLTDALSAESARRERCVRMTNSGVLDSRRSGAEPRSLPRATACRRNHQRGGIAKISGSPKRHILVQLARCRTHTHQNEVVRARAKPTREGDSLRLHRAAHRSSSPHTRTRIPILNPCAAAITNRNWIRLARWACELGDDEPVCIAALVGSTRSNGDMDGSGRTRCRNERSCTFQATSGQIESMSAPRKWTDHEFRLAMGGATHLEKEVGEDDVGEDEPEGPARHADETGYERDNDSVHPSQRRSQLFAHVCAP